MAIMIKDIVGQNDRIYYEETPVTVCVTDYDDLHLRIMNEM